MALVVADRVKETTTSTGTGAISLGGAEPNFRTFSSVLSDADTTYYAIIDDSNLAFEVGLGTYASSGNTITRTTVLASSNSNNAVSFSAGTKDVFLTYPADKSVNRDASGDVSVSGGVTATQVDLTGQGDLRLQDASGGQYVALQAPATVGSSFTFTLPSADGSADQLLKTDGSGNLSFTTVNASPSFTATASGALANGDPVILNSDGTVTVVSGRASATGSTTTFDSGGIDNDTYNLGSTYDSNSNRVVIVYRAGSDYAWAVVGSVSGTTISFGTPVAVSSVNSYYIRATFDSSNNKVVVVYSDVSAGYHGYAAVGTVSGTSISFGTAVEFNDASTVDTTITFDSNSNKAVIAYRKSNVLTAIVGTVSGTSISFGSEVAVYSGETHHMGSTFDTTNNKVVLVYRDQDDSGKNKAVVGTVSGTSISFGSAGEFGDSGNNITEMEKGTVFDSSTGKVVVVYLHSNQVLHAVVGTVSGTSISFGTRVEIDSTVVLGSVGASYDSGAQKIAVTYGDGGNSNILVLNVGTVSGTSISFDGVTTLDSASNSAQSNSDNVYDVNAGTVVVAHRDGSDSNKGNAVATQVGFTNLTSNNFVGISDAAYSNGATATIQISGAVDDAQSSLSAGSDYFVNNLGAIATTGAVFAGKALSTTELAVKYPVPGGMTLISSVTDVSGAATIDLTGMNDGFGVYKLFIADAKPVSQSDLLLQIFVAGSIITESSIYYWRQGIITGTGSSALNGYNDTGDPHIELVGNYTPAGPFTGEVVISRSKERHHEFSWRLAGSDGSTNAFIFLGAAGFKTPDSFGTKRFDMTGVRLKMSSGNLSARQVALYGVS